MDLHQLTQSEQEKLAGLIRDFLVIDHPGIPEFHDDCFFEGIHSTNNFLPWHRVHIRILEDYIRENANAADFPNIPNINDAGFRLPKWQPEIMPSGGLPKIPVPFQATASGIPGNLNINIDPAGLSSELTEMAEFLNRLNNCDNLPQAGFFSDVLEAKYHDHGHTVVGGVMNEQFAPDALLFWPWHAWIDDLWYIWERDCGNFSQPYNFPLASGGTSTEFNGTPPAWTGTMYIKGEIRIKNGATLTIAPGAIIHFRESQYNAFPTRIVVEPGGTLIVDGATLTGIDVFGDLPSTQGDAPGSNYYTAWEGIVVQGAPNNPGVIQLINNARIEHAITGIRTENGGRIYAHTVDFYNNRNDVEIGAYSGYQYAGFYYCNFINDLPLRDIVWIGSPLVASGDCPGGIPEHHINHEQSHSSETHVKVNGNRGAISLHFCTIDNPYQDPHGHYESRGIVSNNSQTFVYGCDIRNQVTGIDGKNTQPGPGRHLTVRSTTFNNNFEGIRLEGVDFTEIGDGNNFIVPDEIPSGVTPPDLLSDIGRPFGIYSDGSSGITVADNTFSTVGSIASEKNYGAILANSSTSAASVEKRNVFTNINIASQAQGNNGNLKIRCNDYNAFQFGIAVTSGVLQTQGLCFSSISPAGNIWDNLGCLNDDNQIFRDIDFSIPFTYWAHSDRKPTCYSPGVSVPPCGIQSVLTSCDDPIIPCSHCEESKIAALETEKSTLIPGDENIQFITQEQLSIYQQGVNERLEHEGLDSAITFTQNVETITSLWPGHKAALLLLKSEQESTITSGTASAIAAISETDPNKKWLSLRYDLLNSGRSYDNLTATEKALVEVEAQQKTKSSAHAKAILEMAYDIPARPYIEPIAWKRNAFLPSPDSQKKAMSIVPNPAQNNVTISFTAPEATHQSSIEIADLNGRILLQFDLSNHFGSSQQTILIDALPTGIYLIRLDINGFGAGVEKIAVIR